MEVRNAKITATKLGYDGGVLTCWLTLEWGSSGQGFGGYRLDGDATTNYGVEFVKEILDAVGVNSWEDLVGKYVRMRGTNARVEAIGHITDDDWFVLAEFVPCP